MENKFLKGHELYTINIIEDSQIHQEWLKTELADNPKIKIINTDQLGRDGIESVKEFKVDMVMLDFQLQDMTGLEVSKRIKNYDPTIKIFILTAHHEASIIERIIKDKNIDAIAIKGSPYFDSHFLTAMIHVLEGDAYIDPMLLKNLRESSGLSNLTKREFEIFIQSYSGKSDETISNDLCVELSHIRNLKSRIAKKIKGDNINNLITRLINNCYPDNMPFVDNKKYINTKKYDLLI